MMLIIVFVLFASDECFSQSVRPTFTNCIALRINPSNAFGVTIKARVIHKTPQTVKCQSTCPVISSCSQCAAKVVLVFVNIATRVMTFHTIAVDQLLPNVNAARHTKRAEHAFSNRQILVNGGTWFYSLL